MSLLRAGGSIGENTASRRAITAACVGNAAEWYDFAIYGALATIIGAVFFPAGNPAAALSAAFAAYGTALLVRPLGALVFGRMGDRRGRRSVLIVVIFLMAGATSAGRVPAGLRHDRPARPGRPPAAARGPGAGRRGRARRGRGLPPGARHRIGAGVESAPGTRQRWESASAAAWPSWPCSVTCSRARDRTPGWWRIAFLVAIPLGLLGLLLRRRITDTDQFVALRAESGLIDRPVRELWRHHRASLLRGFCLLAAGSLAFNTFFIFMPNNLIARHGAGADPDAARDCAESRARRPRRRWRWAGCPIASVAGRW